ncbi:1863_t:CDS:1 [Paraglomus brasilianum]|uniref:1863_t:CDS:1 n=1 Tax=Paraglomus brasilianum TaxID=144538 RepID=A0A9N9E2A2_9GLOM|nr:1863_t:CDS:1 [Paraglomus brasilianum]
MLRSGLKCDYLHHICPMEEVPQVVWENMDLFITQNSSSIMSNCPLPGKVTDPFSTLMERTLTLDTPRNWGGSFPSFLSTPLPTNTKYTTTNITTLSRESMTGEIRYGRYEYRKTSFKLALNLAQP